MEPPLGGEGEAGGAVAFPAAGEQNAAAAAPPEGAAASASQSPLKKGRTQADLQVQQRAGANGESQARSKYAELCKQTWVRPNSEVLRIFGEAEEGRRSAPITSLEFKRNYLGDAGGRALFACLRLLTNLSELNVRSNGLRDGAVVFLCTSVATHPSLGTLDVSDNEINDAHGGRALVHLVTENILITKLRCDNTRMTEKTKGIITSTVLNNCKNAPKMLRKNAYETTNQLPQKETPRNNAHS